MGPTLRNENMAGSAIIYAQSMEGLDQLVKNACPSEIDNAEDFTLDRQTSDEIKRIDKEILASRSDTPKKNMLLVYKYNSTFLDKSPTDLFTNNTRMYPLKEDLR